MELTELEHAISAAPEDEALRRVYADALEERGDPRADHLVLAFRAREDLTAYERLSDLEHAVSAQLTAFSRHNPGHVAGGSAWSIASTSRARTTWSSTSISTGSPA